jgi:hypothetical protein
MVRPWSTRKVVDMHKIPHTPEPEPAPAPLSVRDWALLILEERTRAHLAEALRAPTPEPSGNLCGVLVTFATWRPCCCCGSPVLFVNGQAQSDGDVECGLCLSLREELAERLRPLPVQGAQICAARPSLPVRAALHLWGLWGLLSTGNDNHEARL